MSEEAVMCSCGETRPHEIARRRTADDKAVLLWSDGCVTGAFGFALPGVGTPRGQYERRKAVEAGWLAVEEACAYDLAEVPSLVQTARRAVRQSFVPPIEFLRRSMAGERFRLVKGRIVATTRGPVRTER